MSKEEITLDDQIAMVRNGYERFRNRCRAGADARRFAYLCSGYAILASIVGIPLQYHQSFLDSADIWAVLLLLSAWAAASFGAVCAFASLVISRMRRGYAALLLTTAVLILSLLLSNAFPSYGLGNIH